MTIDHVAVMILALASIVNSVSIVFIAKRLARTIKACRSMSESQLWMAKRLWPEATE